MPDGAPNPLPSITADVTGFSVTVNRHSRAIPWSAVRKITAGKRDLDTHDLIVLHFLVDLAGDPTITLSEDCPGFADLFGPLETALGVNPRWYLEIMTPVFAPSPIVLYLRDPDADGPIR